ncbi:MAG: hypothetical protein ACK4UV_12345, partial [Ignavibacterium sp.]
YKLKNVGAPPGFLGRLTATMILESSAASGLADDDPKKQETNMTVRRSNRFLVDFVFLLEGLSLYLSLSLSEGHNCVMISKLRSQLAF